MQGTVFRETSYYTVEDVAKRLKLNPRTVRDEVARGRLCGLKVGKGWRFAEEDVAAWLEERKRKSMRAASSYSR